MNYSDLRENVWEQGTWNEYITLMEFVYKDRFYFSFENSILCSTKCWEAEKPFMFGGSRGNCSLRGSRSCVIDE